MYEELFHHLLKSDLKEIKALLEKITEKSHLYQVKNKMGMTALSFAVFVCNLEIFQELFEHFRLGDKNEPPKLFLEECICALREAAALGNLDIIKFLLHNKVYPLGYECIIAQALTGRHSNQSKDPKNSWRGPTGHTAISLAVKHGRREVLRYLLPLAVPFSYRGDYGFDERGLEAADIAIETGNVEALKLLYSYGCKVSSLTEKIIVDGKNSGAEILQEKVAAAQNFHNIALRFYHLMRYEKPSKGEEHKFQKEVEELLDNLGDAVLARFGKQYEHPKQVCRNGFEYTAMHFAVLNKHEFMIERLLKMSVAPMIISHHDETFLDLAVLMGNMALFKQLAARLPMTHPMRDRILTRCLGDAIREGHFEMVVVLTNKLFRPGENIALKLKQYCNYMCRIAVEDNRHEILNFLLTKLYLHENLVIRTPVIVDSMTVQSLWINKYGPGFRLDPAIESAMILLREGAYPLLQKTGKLNYENNKVHTATIDLFNMVAKETPDPSQDAKIAFEHCMKLLGNGLNACHQPSLNTVLHGAFIRKNRSYILRFLETDPNVNLANNAGQTPYSLGKAYLEAKPDPIIRTALNCSRAASLLEEIAKGFEILERWKESEYVAECLQAEPKMREEMGKLAKELWILLPECIAALQELTTKITKIEAELLPVDKEAEEELANCKKVPAKMCLRLGTKLAAPEERPLAPMLSYRILKQIDKTDRETFKQANRIMYRLVLQYPELILYSNFANFDRSKEIASIFKNEISEIPARLKLETGTPSKQEEELLHEGAPNAKATSEASEISGASVASTASVPSHEPVTSVIRPEVEVEVQVQALSLEEEQDALDTDLGSEHNKNLVLDKTLAHLVYGEFGDEDDNSTLGNMIIAYTGCTGKEGRGNLQGIPKFTDFKEPSSFLALLKIIREKNISKEKEMADRLADQSKLIAAQEKLVTEKARENEQLKSALRALDPKHPLLSEPEKDSAVQDPVRAPSDTSKAILIGFDQVSATPQAKKRFDTRKFY